jgi:hypothetical protein
LFGFSSRIEFDIFFREKITKPHLYPEESAPLNAQENTDRICTQKGAPLKSQKKNKPHLHQTKKGTPLNSRKKQKQATGHHLESQNHKDHVYTQKVAPLSLQISEPHT